MSRAEIGSGGVQDAYGGSSSRTLTAAASTPFANTKSFNSGTTRKVTAGDKYGLSPTSAISISAWFRTSYTGDEGTLVAKALSGGDYSGWYIHLGGPYYDGKIRWGMQGSTGYILLDSPGGAYYDNVWRHLVVTKGTGTNHASMKMYVNGVQLAGTYYGTAISGTLGSGSTLAIGSREGVMQHLVGQIDEVAIFTRELSPAEVMGICNAGQPAGIESYSPSSWWRMGDLDDTVTLIKDRAGAVDATVVNGQFSTSVPP